MLLVHKQPNHSTLLPAIHLSHRRNPSAPPLLAVQATRTPGLLALSKPRDAPKQPRQTSTKPSKQPRGHVSRHSDDERDQPNTTTKPSESTETSVVPMPSLVAAPTVPPPSAEKPRGRRNRRDPSADQQQQQGSSQQNGPRSVSHAAPKRSQADAAHHSDSDSPSKPSTNASPRKRPQQQRTNTAPPSPVAVVGPPSGRIARNRRARHKSEVINMSTVDLADVSTTSAVTIPQPRRKGSPSRITQPTLSRSAPLNLPPSRKAVEGEKVHALSDWDLPAALDDDLAGDHTWQQLSLMQSGGPRTAPLSKTPADPFRNFSPPPSPTVPRRSSTARHQRSPSYPTDAMFMLSLDEDDKVEDDGLPHTPLRLRNKKAANRFLYAGSSFQNAPNASDLPPPSFLGGTP